MQDCGARVSTEQLLMEQVSMAIQALKHYRPDLGPWIDECDLHMVEPRTRPDALLVCIYEHRNGSPHAGWISLPIRFLSMGFHDSTYLCDALAQHVIEHHCPQVNTELMRDGQAIRDILVTIGHRHLWCADRDSCLIALDLAQEHGLPRDIATRLSTFLNTDPAMQD